MEEIAKGEPGCKAPALRELFLFYQNGKLSVEEQTQISSHLADCESCQLVIRLLGLVKDIEKQDAGQ